MPHSRQQLAATYWGRQKVSLMLPPLPEDSIRRTVGWARELEECGYVGVGGQAGNDVINLPNQGRATVVEIGAAVLPPSLRS